MEIIVVFHDIHASNNHIKRYMYKNIECISTQVKIYICVYKMAYLPELPELGRRSVFSEAVRSSFFDTLQFRFKQSIKVSVF